MKKLIAFIKKEIVFSAACVLAVISMFLVTPSADYINYIDFRTLSLLLSLMLVVQGLKCCGLFGLLVDFVMKKAKNTRQLAMFLVLLCFFSSMLITNDVALITFVPFTIMLLEQIDNPFYSIYLIVLETIAANLGSMLTPIGNPQNLYLYSLSGMKLSDFILLMLPYTLLSLVLLIISTIFIKNKKPVINATGNNNENSFDIKLFIINLILFGICLATVLHLLDYRIMLVIIIITVLLTKRELLLKADYVLLLTFIAFFIFIGNMKKLPVVCSLLSMLIEQREGLVAVIASQLISNVPCAMLLSGFTKQYSRLIIGTNIGGLGTLIASMASLISFKFYSKMDGSSTRRYIDIFSGMNIIFLLALMLLYIILQ